MQLVLLSGGSGKRLWPLSNNVHSKQFLKLFTDANGNTESMVQRVYRQINNNITTSVTIATNENQVALIKKDLSDKVNICVEPCRRDTFPAIALVCAYLKDVMHVDDDECVAVCPVDPYVEDSYYQTVATLETVVKANEANIVLMGIEPTYPSEKYGYIIPANSNPISDVLEFKEKPNQEVAEKYILKNALWNAGVFAFKLGYLLKIAHEAIKFKDYQDLLNKYETVEKISFDYAVVEKETSVKVVRYQGEWKDIGTWDTLSEVMTKKIIGKVFTDKESNNITVINDLDLPVLCMGLKDAVVAVSKDGILIAAKDRCDCIKPYVEVIDETNS